MKTMTQYLFQRKFKSTSDSKSMRYFGCFKMFLMNTIVLLCLKQCHSAVVQSQFILINYEGFLSICCRNNCKYNCQVESRDCPWCMHEEDLTIFFFLQNYFRNFDLFSNNKSMFVMFLFLNIPSYFYGYLLSKQ